MFFSCLISLPLIKQCVVFKYSCPGNKAQGLCFNLISGYSQKNQQTRHKHDKQTSQGTRKWMEETEAALLLWISASATQTRLQVGAYSKTWTKWMGGIRRHASYSCKITCVKDPGLSISHVRRPGLSNLAPGLASSALNKPSGLVCPYLCNQWSQKKVWPINSHLHSTRSSFLRSSYI